MTTCVREKVLSSIEYFTAVSIVSGYSRQYRSLINPLYRLSSTKLQTKLAKLATASS